MKLEEEVLTVHEVAKMLKVHPQTIYVMLRAGKMKGRKIGKTWRILKSDALNCVRGEME